jgi:CheY-like chemotaxis protein
MSKCILSVNGNRAMNYLLQTIFENHYDFIPVTDVYQALYQIKSNKRIQTLILDIDYQSDEIWNLVEHIKSSKLFQIPIIILSTSNSETISKKCYAYEIDEIFFKPFNPLELTTAVSSILELKWAANS